MKTSLISAKAKYPNFIIVLLISFALTQVSFCVFAQNKDRSISNPTKIHLDAYKKSLNFPKTVERYYQSKNFQLSWVEKGKTNANAETAMMLLNCVRQFGLNPADYHPTELSYRRLKILTEGPDSVIEAGRPIFDLLLTDAVITMINHLHYGKFNPSFTSQEIDNGNLPHFNADFVLFRIIELKDFYSALIKVQPTSIEYDHLQKNMQLVLGQYILDNDEYPEANVRKMAINMERLRWLFPVKGNHIQVNIPSYQLKLTMGDQFNLFKVVVGNPANPTQTFESTLDRFTAAPEWKVPAELFVAEILPAALKNIKYLDENCYSIYDNKHQRVKVSRRRLIKISQNPGAYMARQSPSDENTLGRISFRMDDHPDGTLYDHREKNVFNGKQRASSKGCMQVENPELLARLLLTADGAGDQIEVLASALKDYRYKNFYLKNPLPIAVTYLTCEMIDSRLVIYKDIYQKDNELENKIFGEQQIRFANSKSTKKANRKNDVKTLRR